MIGLSVRAKFKSKVGNILFYLIDKKNVVLIE